MKVIGVVPLIFILTGVLFASFKGQQSVRTPLTPSFSSDSFAYLSPLRPMALLHAS